jgi:hypothetical protein
MVVFAQLRVPFRDQKSDARKADVRWPQLRAFGGNMSRTTIRVLGIIPLMVLLLCSPIWAQTATGVVLGVVSDQQGAVVSGARVSVINTATAVARHTTTNQAGYFDVEALPIGMYKVSVESQGFNTEVTQEQKLEINKSLRFDITLSVGKTSQTVTVNAAVAGVETVNPTVGDSVTGSAIVNLPLNGRDTLQLAELQPGVTESNPGAAGGGYSISGGRTDDVTYLLDGGLNTDLLENTVVFNPNPDAIAEFRILTSNYTAEYGRNGGGIISEVTKSGTSELHGSIFDYLRNDSVDANSFFTKYADLPKDILKRNQYGGTLGGPILIPGILRNRDRNYFFVSYQGQKQSESVTQTLIPTFTPDEAKGNFSTSDGGAPDPSVVAFLQAHPSYALGPASQAIINPGMLDPVATAYFSDKLIPTFSTGIYNSTAASTDDRNELTIKLDLQASDTNKISVSLGGNRINQLLPYGDSSANVPGYDNTDKMDQYFANISDLQTFSATLLNDFRFTAQRSSALDDTPVENLPSPQKLGILINPDLAYGPSSLYFDNGLSVGFNLNGPTTFPDTTWSYSDTLTWLKGRNSWKFGVYFSAYQDNLRFSYAADADYQFGDNGRPNSIGNQFADFVLGNAANFEQGPSAPNNIRSKSTYLFGQDELHVNNHLTLTLGLRYEYNSPKTDTHGRTDNLIQGLQSTRFPAAPMGLVFPGDKGAPTGLYFPDKTNFAPRFGFAWTPWKNEKTSIRGGFGIFYNVVNGRDNIDQNGAQPFASYEYFGFYTVPSFTPGQKSALQNPYGVGGVNNPFPTPPSADITDWIKQFGPFNATTDNPFVRTPYIYQYNLSVERELYPTLVATASYVGSVSRNLISNKYPNAMIPGTTNRLLDQNQTNPTIASECSLLNPATDMCPFIGAFPIFTGGGNATYSGLQASLVKQSGDTKIGKMSFTLAYTLGHSIDNNSGAGNRSSYLPYYNPNEFRASSDFDVRHTITFSGVWDLPFDHLWARGPRRITSGWMLSPIVNFRTGFPLRVNAEYPSTGDNDPGSSGAGDPSLTDALFAPGFNSVKTLKPSFSSLTYFNPGTFTNQQYVSVLDDPVNGVPCSQQVPGHEFASRDCILSTPSLRTYGTPRNLFRGPGRENLDLSFAKQTQFARLATILRLDIFNTFNNTQFLNVNTSLNATTFGQVTSTYPPRILQVSLDLKF